MKTNSVRVISGEYKGRKLKFPSIQGLRPTSDQMKETIFNWLQPYIYDSICIDAFAGSGSLGIEAISRGATKSIFYEINLKAIKQIKENLDTLHLSNFEVKKADSLKALTTLDTQNNECVIFLDPPFNKGIAEKAMHIIDKNDAISNDTIIYLETEKNCNADLSNFEILKEKNTSTLSARLIKKAN